MPGSFYYYSLGDEHWLREGVAIKKFRKVVKDIAALKHAFWGSMGDQNECIPPGDKRYRHAEQYGGKGSTFKHQAKEFKKEVDPILDKGLEIGMGNHELKYSNIFDTAEYLAEICGMDYATYACVLQFPTFKVFEWHGDGRVQSRAYFRQQRKYNNSTSIMKKLREGPSGDCLVNIMHHVHHMNILEPDDTIRLINTSKDVKAVYPEPGCRIDLKGGYYIPDEYKWFCSGGGFVKQYIEGVSTYAEVKLYPPAELGCLRLEVRNDKLVGVEKIIV